MRKFAFFVVLLLSTSLLAQLGGDATYRFLELSSTPRQLALGNPVTLNDNDISATLANPAIISGIHGGQIMVNYEPYFDGIHRGAAAYAHTLNREKAIVFDVKYINYGSFDGADALGNPTANFGGSEVAIGLASSHYFLSPNLFFGARVRYILSNLESYSSSGLTADAGVYFSPIGKTWRVGLVYENLGKQLTSYEDVFEPLPANLTLGFSNALEHLPLRWHVSFHHLNKWPLLFDNPEEATTDLNGNSTAQSSGLIKKILRHPTFGAEVFPEGVFSIRLGYHVQRAAELRILDVRNFSGLTFGVGIQLRRLRFQLSHARYNVAGNRTFLGLTLEPKK